MPKNLASRLKKSKESSSSNAKKAKPTASGADKSSSLTAGPKKEDVNVKAVSNPSKDDQKPSETLSESSNDNEEEHNAEDQQLFQDGDITFGSQPTTPGDHSNAPELPSVYIVTESW